MKNAFYEKPKVNFELYDGIGWEANNCNTQIVEYLKK